MYSAEHDHEPTWEYAPPASDATLHQMQQLLGDLSSHAIYRAVRKGTLPAPYKRPRKPPAKTRHPRVFWRREDIASITPSIYAATRSVEALMLDTHEYRLMDFAGRIGVGWSSMAKIFQLTPCISAGQNYFRPSDIVTPDWIDDLVSARYVREFRPLWLPGRRIGPRRITEHISMDPVSGLSLLGLILLSP